MLCRQFMVGVLVVSCVAAASGQEFGRAELPASSHSGYAPQGAWSLKTALSWANVDWDLGPASGSESVFGPQVSLSYRTTETLDVNVSLISVSAEDEDDVFGGGEADLTRLTLGLRHWFSSGGRVTPFFGAGIGYYFVDGSTARTRDAAGQVVAANVTDVADAPGAYLEGGAAFEVSDGFFLSLDLGYDTLLGSADATINGRSEDLDIHVVSVNLGAMWLF